jgi:hypothetical protein
MKSLLDIYSDNKGKRPLFSEIIHIDFYDSPTEALCRLVESEHWFICSLVYIDIKGRERIFTMLEINNQLLLEFKSVLEKLADDREVLYQKLKTQVKAVYKKYSGNIFLFKSDWLNAAEYEVVEIPLKHLQYFKDIEVVLEQNENSKLQWIRFFNPLPD